MMTGSGVRKNQMGQEIKQLQRQLSQNEKLLKEAAGHSKDLEAAVRKKMHAAPRR